MLRRSRLLLPLAALSLATACGGSDEPEAAATASATPPPAPLECVDFPVDKATELLTDPASGEQRYAGTVTKAVSVRNTALPPDQAPVHAIAIDVEGKSFVLVHAITDGSQEPTGEGPYAAVTSNTAAATGAPEDRDLEAMGGAAVGAAVGCLTG